MMNKFFTSTTLLFLIFITLTSCNTILRGSTQTIKLKSNVDSIVLTLDSIPLNIHQQSFLLPRGSNASFIASKKGYESQSIRLTSLSNHLPLNLSLGLATSATVLASSHPNSGGVATSLLLSIWWIGGFIDLASGSHFVYYPKEVKINLYPSLQGKTKPNLSIECSSFQFPESKFIAQIGNRELFIQGQSTPNYLSSNKVLQSTIAKDVINEYLSYLGCVVPNKKFNSDSITSFKIEAIVDTLLMNDSQLKANDRVDMNKNQTYGEITQDFSERMIYTHLALSISWRITHIPSNKTIDKVIRTETFHYSEGLPQVFGKHLRTNFNQLLNLPDVQDFLRL